MRNRLLRHEYFTLKKYRCLLDRDFKVFLGLLCYADRDGKILYNVSKLERFFVDIKDITRPINRILEIGLIHKYHVDTLEYLIIDKEIWNGQRIFGLEKSSTMPNPPEVMDEEPVKNYKDKIKIDRRGGKIIDEDFLTFMANYPISECTHMEKSRAYREWKKLIKNAELPSVNYLIIYARNHDEDLPNPSTYLHRKMWKKDKSVECSYCNNERVVYGIRPDGTKGVIPCPICQKTKIIHVQQRLKGK